MIYTIFGSVLIVVMCLAVVAVTARLTLGE
jgi:hypothetical protein